MIYVCKCGKSFSKSGNAATTGFRDTKNCHGCPHLLPYGENRFDDERRAFVLDIKGYECRASQFLRYQTELSGALDDKTTIRIESLDFDFLERVSNWVKDHYPDGELFGSFSREDIRSAEYTSDGRYRYSLSCSQNKKGIAAKRALWAEFFDEIYHRTDMSAEEEKDKILKDIQLGIERAKEAVNLMYYDENTGWVYRVSPQPEERELYFIEYLDPSNSVIFKRLPDYPGSKFKESAEEVLAARAQRNGWTPTAPLEIAAEGDKGCDDSMLAPHINEHLIGEQCHLQIAVIAVICNRLNRRCRPHRTASPRLAVPSLNLLHRGQARAASKKERSRSTPELHSAHFSS